MNSGHAAGNISFDLSSNHTVTLYGDISAF